ncbi:MAG: hypothetical protein LBS21_06770 [Clostridiales bacterium]|jgi:hypothetical protein|nr:hypothetical protein [Clostridiales bacterium]
MTELEHVYQSIHDKNIAVYNLHFSPTIKSMCVCAAEESIILDKNAIETQKEEIEIITHEITHIETGNTYCVTSTSNTRLARANRNFYEAKTERATIRKLLPPEKLQRAIFNVGCEYRRIADYCNRTLDFVKKAFNYYETIGIQFELPEYSY